MELRHLRYFVAVADELHFTRAAARLQTAQPALSQQIRRLERELGVELLRRTNRSVVLTDAGRVFLDHARRVLDEADQAGRAARRAARGEIGRLVVGFVPEAAADLLPELLTAYRSDHPDVEIVLHEMHTLAQREAIDDGRLHVGLLLRRIDAPELDTLLLQRQRVVVAMPATHPLADRPTLRLDELAGERWIQPGTSGSLLYVACAEAGFEPIIVHQTPEHQTRLALVASGVGMALVVERAPQLRSRHIVYKQLRRPKLTVDVALAWDKRRHSPLVDGFIDIARQARRR